MNKTLLILVLLGLLFTLTLSVHHDSESNSGASVSDDSDDSDANEPIMGGWSRVNVDDVKAYEDVLDYLQSQTNDLPQGSKLIKVSRQVVAGINYKFLFKQGETYREVVVWKQLDGKFEVTSNLQVTNPQEIWFRWSSLLITFNII